MTIKYGKKKSRQYTVFYTIITALLLSVVFFSMVNFLYNKAEEEAYENLHVQTRQVKDDLVLQLTSDRENLLTMASFASKLYMDGDDYSLLFESFKPIGMIENIGILNADNIFMTKAGSTDLTGIFSFAEEKEKGIYISGMVNDVVRRDIKFIRSAVPIKVNGEVVGILYGVIKPQKLWERYAVMVKEFDAQLFVYEKENGNMLVDTINEDHKNISFLSDRQYNKGYSYEQFRTTDKGFTAFESAYKNETLHLHYSAIEEFGWMIAMGRYDSQVLAGAHTRSTVFALVYIIMLGIIFMYILCLMVEERKLSAISECASDVRKELLETTGEQNNIQDALIEVCRFAKSRSAIFFDTDGEFYHYIDPKYEEIMISQDERQFLCSELFRYASVFYDKNNKAVNVMCIKPDIHMIKTNPYFFDFLKDHGIWEVSLSATTNKANHIAILATINSKKGSMVRKLAEKVSACFSMALYNKNHLDRTILAATTDSLTGAYNRVSYKSDLLIIDQEKPLDFSCIYIDVNELHVINNKYGHAAGDEMLMYIANTLKEVFFPSKVYRMGGDEFLVFSQNTKKEFIEKNIKVFKEKLKTRDYHAAVGMCFKNEGTDVEEMVIEAEVQMYKEKAEYYQNKEHPEIAESGKNDFVQFNTGILEIDTMLSILKEKYNGIYRVSLATDSARRILMPAYLNYNEEEEHFSKLFSKYVAESVDPDYHRAVLSFLNYKALKNQLMDGDIPRLSFKKNNGELVVLSVYRLGKAEELISDTLWVFAK